jgi:regulatory LuxR family protein
VPEGLTNLDIAQRLGLSLHTVKNYLFHIFDKLGVSNRVNYWGGVLSFHGPDGPPIDMKMRLSGACTLMEGGGQRSVYTLDEVRPFLRLIRNARFEPICVAPLCE